MQKVHISRHLEVQKQALTSSSALQILITTYNYNTEIAAQWRKDCFFRTIFHNQGFCLIVGLKLSKNLWKEIFLFENESWGCNEESCSFSCEYHEQVDYVTIFFSDASNRKWGILTSQQVKNVWLCSLSGFSSTNHCNDFDISFNFNFILKFLLRDDCYQQFLFASILILICYKRIKSIIYLLHVTVRFRRISTFTAALAEPRIFLWK